MAKGLDDLHSLKSKTARGVLEIVHRHFVDQKGEPTVLVRTFIRDLEPLVRNDIFFVHPYFAREFKNLAISNLYFTTVDGVSTHVSNGLYVECDSEHVAVILADEDRNVWGFGFENRNGEAQLFNNYPPRENTVDLNKYLSRSQRD